MPLSPIPPNPRPTRAELAAQIERRRGEIADEFLARWARFYWECERKKERPDEFLCAFSGWIAAHSPEFRYDEYLRSDSWRQIRARVLVAARYECAGCFNRAAHVHHRDYRPRVLRGEDDSPLVALCKRCHDNIHAADPSWQEIERRLDEIVTLKDSVVAENSELMRPAKIARKESEKRGGGSSPDLNEHNRERQREYRRIKKLGGGDIYRGRAMEAEERRSKMSPYDVGSEDACSRLAALEMYNACPSESCPYSKGSSEEAEYDRGWQATMKRQPTKSPRPR